MEIGDIFLHAAYIALAAFGIWKRLKSRYGPEVGVTIMVMMNEPAMGFPL